MTPTNTIPNSNATAFIAAPTIPESAEVRRARADRDSFAAYAVAKAISAHDEPVVLIERGKQVRRKLTPTAKLLAWVLASHVNTKTGQCNPSRKTVAAEMGCGLRVVQDAVHLLTNAGLLKVERGTGNRASYTLLAVPDEHESALPDEHVIADPDEHVSAHPTVNYEEELRRRTNSSTGVHATRAAPTPSTTPTGGAAADSSSSKSWRERDMATTLADYVARDQRGFSRPAVRAGDRERIHELIEAHGANEFQRRVTYALNHWPDVLTQHLGRFIGAFDELGRQHEAFIDRLEREEAEAAREFCPRCNDGYGDLCPECEDEIERILATSRAEAAA